ncbi:MAG: hypothetical protein LC800_22445 [Acidobacteria bacterium]|nr:hypothetical protein [Acidobacteriota bacterium]
MIQLDANTYKVEAGEQVTVEIVAIQVVDSSAFTLDGVLQFPEPGISPKTYTFFVSVGPGLTHFGNVSCLFPNAAPDKAKFQIFVSGDMGGEIFTGPDIRKTDVSPDSDLEFRRA